MCKPLYMEMENNLRKYTVHEIHKEDLRWQYMAAILGSISTFATGTIAGFTAQISTQLLDGALGFQISEDSLGWIASLNLLSAGVMALIAGSISDLIGRKTLLLLLAIPLTGSWLLIYYATSVEMVFLGRLISGMVGGANCAVFAVYANEIASPSIRGTLGSLTNLSLSFGILFDAIVGKYLSIYHYIAACSCVPAVFMLTFVFMPESPIYLVKKEYDEKAKQSFKFFYRNLATEALVVEEINKARENMNNDTKISRNWINLYTSIKDTEAGRNAFVILLILMSFRVFVGVDAVNSYSSYIFKSANMDFDPQYGTMILMAIQVVAGLFQSSVVDKMGRRKLLLSSMLLILVCLIAVATCLILKERDLIDSSYFVYSDYLLLIALAVFFVAYSLGYGPIPFLMVVEIFPVETKSVASALGVFLTKICAFIVSKTFIMIKGAGGQDIAFYAYAVLTVIGGVLIYFKIPETKGKTNKDIMTLLSRNKNP